MSAPNVEGVEALVSYAIHAYHRARLEPDWPRLTLGQRHARLLELVDPRAEDGAQRAALAGGLFRDRLNALLMVWKATHG